MLLGFTLDQAKVTGRFTSRRFADNLPVLDQQREAVVIVRGVIYTEGEEYGSFGKQ